jgi:hypothetical protein
MADVQIMCARLGIVTGLGLAGVIRVRYPRWILWSACALPVVANIVNIAANLGGMADVTGLRGRHGLLVGVWTPPGLQAGLHTRAGTWPTLARAVAGRSDCRLLKDATIAFPVRTTPMKNDAHAEYGRASCAPAAQRMSPGLLQTFGKLRFQMSDDSLGGGLPAVPSDRGYSPGAGGTAHRALLRSLPANRWNLE